MADEFFLDSYMKRIRFDGTTEPNLKTLMAVHAAHVDAIPFEALDPLLGRPVSLDLGSLQRKLVDSRRGGYCFEQNVLFKVALEKIGFRVTGLTGRVRWMSPPDSALGPREHMMLKVDLPEGPYLADVGFGACVLDSPLRFDIDAEQRTAMGTYRLGTADGHFSLSAKQPAGWRTMYLFNLEPQIDSDYELGNWYTSTSLVPPFKHVLIMERVSSDKRYKLINRRFVIETRDGEVAVERSLDDADALDCVLNETFNIRPPVSAQEILARLKG